jgi:hypothetical protein
MLAGADPAFDGPVILFENIIEVLHRSMPAISSKAPSALSCTIAGG